MRIALSSDERTELTDFLVRELEARGHTVLRFGAIAEGDPEVDWPGEQQSSACCRARRSRRGDRVLLDGHRGVHRGEQSARHSRGVVPRCRNRAWGAHLESR